MITIEFRHIALFDTDSDGATVLFPASKHTAWVGQKGNAMRELKGLCWIDGRDANGRSVPLNSTGFDKNDFVPSLNAALGRGVLDRIKVRPALDLLDPEHKAIQASLRLVGGKLVAKRGIAICPDDDKYMDEEWQIGDTDSKLTNRVDYTLKVAKGVAYTLKLNNDTDQIPLVNGMTILIQNVDTPPVDCSKEREMSIANVASQIDLSDFDLLFKLLEGSPEGPFPKLTIPPSVEATSYPTRPLCPVGTP